MGHDLSTDPGDVHRAGVAWRSTWRRRRLVEDRVRDARNGPGHHDLGSEHPRQPRPLDHALARVRLSVAGLSPARGRALAAPSPPFASFAPLTPLGWVPGPPAAPA